jgi:hypothetical protein
MSNKQFSELFQRAKCELQTIQATVPYPAPASISSMFKQLTVCPAAHGIGSHIAYIPDFMDAESASAFAALIEANSQSWGGWARLHHRSLLNLGGVPHPSGTIAERLPHSLQVLCQCIHRAGALPFEPDQCLLNR